MADEAWRGPVRYGLQALPPAPLEPDAQEERRQAEARVERYHRLVAAVAQGLVTASGANLPSSTLVAKTMELAGAVFVEAERRAETLR